MPAKFQPSPVELKAGRLTIRYAPVVRELNTCATSIEKAVQRAPCRTFRFLDQQGVDCHLSFIDADDRSFKVVLARTFDVGLAPAQ